jgi:hypothetical protein
MVSRRLNLLRLDYAFSVLTPCLFAIYHNGYNLFAHLDIIFGFLFYAITGNTINDAIDMRDPNEKETIERTQGFHWKEIMAIAIISFLFGSMMFVRTIRAHPINALYLILTIIMVIVYCLKKSVPIINQILLGVSHIIFPYLMIKVDAGANPLISSSEWLLMITFLSYAFSGQVVHEIIDGDAITRFSLATQQKVVIISSIFTIIMGIITIIVLDNWYFFPLALIPVGSIYTFRVPTKSTQGVKDVGIVLGNIIMFYFLVLILQNMYFANML